jgi:exodeoxyribonuclease VII large subunit
MRTLVRDRQGLVAAVAGKLETLSPLGVLGRGYSLTYRGDGQGLITSAEQLRAGERITTRFQRGSAVSVVESVEKESDGVRVES